MDNNYFCIFAGGGVRGTSYLGVLKVLELFNINITGMAGSSAGAIFSALCAVGYSYEELESIIFNIDYKKFQDFALPSVKEFGLCKGDNFYYWLKSIIEQKFYENSEGENPPVTFKDLNKDLVIIATNISKKSYKEYSKRTTPDSEIAHAVRASISVPGLFKPVWEEDDCLIDGDVVKNFPLWLFSKELIENHFKIIEFRLEGEQSFSDINNPFDYFNAILDTFYKISTDLLVDTYGQNDQFEIIPINSGQSQIIDFNISDKQKVKLIQAGEASALNYFNDRFLEKRKLLIEKYEILHKKLKILTKNLNNDSIEESMLNLSDIIIFVVENKELVHKQIYLKILEIKNYYNQNLLRRNFLRKSRIKNKDVLLAKLTLFDEFLNKHLQGLIS